MEIRFFSHGKNTVINPVFSSHVLSHASGKGVTKAEKISP